MDLDDIKLRIPSRLFSILDSLGIKALRPAQEKAIDAGLLLGKNVVVCTPTASGKTLIAELAMLKGVLESHGKAVYVVPLKALASEKYRSFQQRYGQVCKVALSVGDSEGEDVKLQDADIIICTSEKLDSIIRHRAGWIKDIGVLVVDEIHLLNDPGRGPTLEVVLTLLRKIIPDVQIVGLSATIGNPGELADWLKAECVIDSWRPVPLKKGIFHDDVLELE